MKTNPHLVIAAIFLLITIATFAFWPDAGIKWLFLGLFGAELLNSRNKRLKDKRADQKAKDEIGEG